MPNRIAHFEIHAQDPERAVKFYVDSFGWDIKKWEGGGIGGEAEYWMVMTAKDDKEPGGINGGLIRRKGAAPVEGQAVNSHVNTIVVDDYDAIHEKIVANGGSVAVPKIAMTGFAWQGYYKDTEGNIFGLHQADPNAK